MTTSTVPAAHEIDYTMDTNDVDYIVGATLRDAERQRARTRRQGVETLKLSEPIAKAIARYLFVQSGPVRFSIGADYYGALIFTSVRGTRVHVDGDATMVFVAVLNQHDEYVSQAIFSGDTPVQVIGATVAAYHG